MWVIGSIQRPRVWIVVATAVVFAAAFLTVLLLRDNGGAAGQENAQAAYCLSTANRADFLQAASNLRLGDPVSGESDRVLVGKKEMALRDWRVDRKLGNRFREACAAFSAATEGPATAAPSGGGSTVVTFLLALVTALVPVGLTTWLNYLTTARKDAAAARQSRIDLVRAAALRFGQAADAYLNVRTGSTGSGAEQLATMREHQRELTAGLARMITDSPGWDRPRELRARLQAELQGDFVGRIGKIDDGLAASIRAIVDNLTAEAEAVTDEYAGAGNHPATTTVVASNPHVTRS